MEKMDKATESRVLRSIEKAISLTKEGMDSNKALLKVATDEHFHPEIVKRMAEAMNISRTRAHMQKESAEKRAEAFPLVDARWVIDQMYPPRVEAAAQVKAANWVAPEYLRPNTDNIDLFKVNKEVPKLTKAAEVSSEIRRKSKQPTAFADDLIFAKQATLRRLDRDGKSEFRAAFFHLTKMAGELGMQFRDPYRYDYADVERRVFAKYGSLGKKLMDLVYETGGLGKLRRPIKRASLTEGEKLVWDSKKAPFNLIEAMFKKADELTSLGKKAIDRECDLVLFNDKHNLKQAWDEGTPPKLLDDLLGEPLPYGVKRANSELEAQIQNVGKQREAARPGSTGGVATLGQYVPPAELQARMARHAQPQFAHSREALQKAMGGGVPPPAAATNTTSTRPVVTASSPGQQQPPPVGVIPGVKMNSAKGKEDHPFAKAAIDPLSTGAAGGMLALGLRGTPDISKYREVLADVYDPQHEAKLDSIKTKAMLNDFLSNDPILSSYDPEEVTNVYNQIAVLAPAASRQPALMRGLLRKSIQQGGVIEPFEVQQLTQMERAFRGEQPPHHSPLHTESRGE